MFVLFWSGKHLKILPTSVGLGPFSTSSAPAPNITGSRRAFSRDPISFATRVKSFRCRNMMQQ
jgi:hypothetical protein